MWSSIIEFHVRVCWGSFYFVARINYLWHSFAAEIDFYFNKANSKQIQSKRIPAIFKQFFRHSKQLISVRMLANFFYFVKIYSLFRDELPMFLAFTPSRLTSIVKSVAINVWTSRENREQLNQRQQNYPKCTGRRNWGKEIKISGY